MTDIRLMLSFRSHPKVKKLRLKLGEGGPLGFIYLLMHAADHKPDGLLAGMDRDDIALAADFRGDPDDFVRVLLALRLLDFDGKTYSIHDYADHQPWVAKSPERKEKARNAANVRYGNQKAPSTNNQQLSSKNDATSMQPACGEHANAMRLEESSTAPFLSLPILSLPNADKTETYKPAGPPQNAAGGFDYSNWQPDEICLNRIQLTAWQKTARSVPAEFIECERLEFITVAEDGRIPERLLRARFQGQVQRNWLKALQRETNTGPLQKALPADLRAVPDDRLEVWSLARDGPMPATGETYDEYRNRIALHLKNRERDGTTSYLQSAAASLAVN